MSYHPKELSKWEERIRAKEKRIMKSREYIKKLKADTVMMSEKTVEVQKSVCTISVAAWLMQRQEVIVLEQAEKKLRAAENDNTKQNEHLYVKLETTKRINENLSTEEHIHKDFEAELEAVTLRVKQL